MWVIDVKLKISHGATHFVSSLRIAMEEITGNEGGA
jgi:hypothetical protein